MVCRKKSAVFALLIFIMNTLRMDGLNKYVLFYSTNCQYSRKLLDIIEKNGLESSFTKVNIDFTDDIPSFVSHVPTVLLSKQSKISGQAVFEWMKKLTEKSTIQPTSFNQLSDPYSFIGNQQEDIHTSYSLLGCDYGGGPSAGKGPAMPSKNKGMPQENVQKTSGDDMMQRIIDSRSNEVPQMINRV